MHKRPDDVRLSDLEPTFVCKVRANGAQFLRAAASRSQGPSISIADSTYANSARAGAHHPCAQQSTNASQMRCASDLWTSKTLSELNWQIAAEITSRGTIHRCVIGSYHLPMFIE